MWRDFIFSLKKLYFLRNRLKEGVFQDIRQRYVGSVFGSLWAFLYPLLHLSIYAGLYSFVFKVRPSGLTTTGYILLVFSGLVPLMAFNEALTAASSALNANKNLLLNTVFPSELIPFRAALSAQVTSIVGLFITLSMALVLGKTSFWLLPMIALFWLLLVMFAIGLGWIFSLLSLVARDIQHTLSLLMMLLFILSPFAYTPDMVPLKLRPFLYLNPLSYFVLSFQQMICYGNLPEPLSAGGVVVLGVLGFSVGLLIFHKVKFVFFDYV